MPGRDSGFGRMCPQLTLELSRFHGQLDFETCKLCAETPSEVKPKGYHRKTPYPECRTRAKKMEMKDLIHGGLIVRPIPSLRAGIHKTTFVNLEMLV